MAHVRPDTRLSIHLSTQVVHHSFGHATENEIIEELASSLSGGGEVEEFFAEPQATSMNLSDRNQHAHLSLNRSVH